MDMDMGMDMDLGMNLGLGINSYDFLGHCI